MHTGSITFAKVFAKENNPSESINKKPKNVKCNDLLYVLCKS